MKFTHLETALSFVISLGLFGLGLALLTGCAVEGPEGESDAGARNLSTPAEPWTEQELMDPAELARILEDPAREDPVILDIGGVGRIMGGRIQGSHLIGPTRQPANLARLREFAATLQKDSDLVIYCGCCPFEDCPNIRPAFRTLQEMELTDLKLLDIPRNLRVDWVNLGYPIEE